MPPALQGSRDVTHLCSPKLTHSSVMGRERMDRDMPNLTRMTIRITM